MNPPSAVRLLSAVTLAAMFPIATSVAQCAPQWQPGDPLPQVRGYTGAMTTWDPDGAGPLLPVLVVGGRFDAGDLVQTTLATFDGSQWSSLGSLSTADAVTALADWNGSLVAATAGNIYRWTGVDWQVFGFSVGGAPFVAVLGTWNGDLYAGGSFTGMNGLAANNIARWNGTAWSTLGSGTNGVVKAFATWNGQLQVGGAFTSAGVYAAGNLASWNGSGWTVGAAFNGPIEALAVFQGMTPSSWRLFAAGSFTTAGGVAAQHIAALNPSTGTWAACGAGLSGSSTTCLFATNTGLGGVDLVAGVHWPGQPQKMWRWNGSTWSALAGIVDVTGDVIPSAIRMFAGQFVVGLLPFGQPDSIVGTAVRKWTGTWSPLVGRGILGPVLAIDTDGSDVVIAGSFVTISGVTMNGVARGGPGAWQPLGTGPGIGACLSVARTAGGDVWVGLAGFPYLSRWNGASWNGLAGPTGPVYALRRLASGDVIAGGSFSYVGSTLVNNIARWNGTTWSPLGVGANGTVRCIAELPNGDVVVGGDFTQMGLAFASRIARWNGSQWGSFGAGMNDSVHGLAVMPNGDIVAGGTFQFAGAVAAPYVARWNGVAWSPLFGAFPPNAPVLSVLALPDGDVLAGGQMTNYSQSFPPVSIHSCLMRQNGVQWQTQQVVGTPYSTVTALARIGNGILVGGSFDRAGSLASGNLARFATPCPAMATPYGTGCAGAGGTNVLTATAPPWTGSTFRARATGMPALALAVVATGFTSLALPIAAILPQGVAGCMVLVSPDVLDTQVPSAGTVNTQVAIPDTASLIGVQFFQQVVPFELDLGLNITAITSTNALAMTIGLL